jgi:hypothetical protein
MIHPTIRILAAAAASLLLASCGGGGGGDVHAGTPPAAPPTTAVGAAPLYLVFPNPQKQADGSIQTTAREYAEAYYRDIDPLNERDTAAKYRAKNGFDSGTGEQITVVFGDVRDLGTGRRMTVRRNPDGTVAFFVENYAVKLAADYAFNQANLDAAIVRDTRWLPYSNGIEFSPGPNGGVSFPKFYNFNGATGERQLLVNIDGPRRQGDAGRLHQLPRRARRRAHAAGRERPAPLPDHRERRVAGARRRAGPPASVRGRCARLLRHAGLHARRAGSGDQDHQQVDPVHVPEDGGRQFARGRVPAARQPERVAGNGRGIPQGRVRRPGHAERDLRGQLRAAVRGCRTGSRRSTGP